ncbi:MAG: hypothetical protein HY279_05720 [Nitrospinae bacterium]|nr:hypothetical protein [Nitrospinota bacterium]
MQEPLTKEFENFIDSFGKLKYPLGEGFSFIRLETEDFLITGNIGLKELKFTIKHGASSNIKNLFEIRLEDYLNTISNKGGN